MQRYNGPHLHAALKCLRTGFPANAVSWMWRDIGELTRDPGEEPDPATLQDGGNCIHYEPIADVLSCQDGGGI